MTPQPNPTAEDMADFVTPVAEMPSPPPQRQSKGLSFDFNGLIGRLQTNGFESLSAPQKELLYHLKENPDLQMSPEQMAMFVTETDKRLREQSSPKAQAEASAAQLSARKTQLDIGKLEQETIAKAKDQAELNTRKSLVLDKINKYTNPQAANFTDISPLVGKFDGTAGAMLDSGGYDDQRAAQRAELERLVNNDVLELTKFLKPVSQDELKFLKSMSPRLHQNGTIWKEYLLDAKSRIEGMTGSTPAQAPAQPAAQSQAAPAQPKQPVIRVIRGQTFVQQPNGKFIPQ